MRFLITIVSISFCCFALLTNASAQISNSSSINIICIGDSITQGGNVNDEEYTYRLPLYRLLKQKGFNIDFIGTRKQGLNEVFRWPSDFDADHEGFYGASTNEVREALKADLPKLPAPDIALIDLGSNDQGKDVRKAVITPLTDIITQLRARNPQVTVLIVQIPGIFKNFGMHFWTWRMAQKLSQPNSPIITIPLYLGWDTKGDTFEGSHPNIRGQNKMAAAFFSVLEPLLQTISEQNESSR